MNDFAQILNLFRADKQYPGIVLFALFCEPMFEDIVFQPTLYLRSLFVALGINNVSDPIAHKNKVYGQSYGFCASIGE